MINKSFLRRKKRNKKTFAKQIFKNKKTIFFDDRKKLRFTTYFSQKKKKKNEHQEFLFFKNHQEDLPRQQYMAVIFLYENFVPVLQPLKTEKWGTLQILIPQRFPTTTKCARVPHSCTLLNWHFPLHLSNHWNRIPQRMCRLPQVDQSLITALLIVWSTQWLIWGH